MKHIKTFEGFWGRHDDRVEYEYLILEIMENGDLKISLTEEGREKAEEDGIDYENFHDYFEDIRGNSEYMYFEDLGEAGLGMTSAPAITDGYYFDDDGGIVEENGSELYWYPNYVIKDFSEVLRKKGYVIFQTYEPKTKEEIEEQRLKNITKKYNI